MRRTDLIVEELQRLKGLGKAADIEEEKRKFVIFSLQGGLYAFEGAEVKEILPSLEIFPIPGAPRSVPGVINNRGEIEAVIDLHSLFDLPETGRTPAGRIALTEKAGVRSGILVDSIVDVVDLPQSSIEPPLATLSGAVRDLVAGATVYEGRSVVLLDIGRILEALRTYER